MIQNLKPEPFSDCTKPFDPACAVPGEFEQELLFVTSAGDVPEMIGKKIPVRSRHEELL
jgi:hypothetical protein